MSFTVTKVLRPEALDPEGILDGNLDEEAEDGNGKSADEKVKKSSDVVESAEFLSVKLSLIRVVACYQVAEGQTQVFCFNFNVVHLRFSQSMVL
ncbi:unnamed protein product [Brassica oleracea]